MNAPELELHDDRLAPVETIDCISLWQPWATWIAWGWKTIECRGHTQFARLVGKRVAIHAAKKFDDHALTGAVPFLTSAQITRAANFRYPHGSLVCTIFARDFRRLTSADTRPALCVCTPRDFGLIFEADDVLALPSPVSFRGQMGIFPVPRSATDFAP